MVAADAIAELKEDVLYLEGFADETGRLQRLPLKPLPFRIGRNPAMHLVLPFSNVSKVHSEIYLDGQNLMICDLGSTNGTFVNNTAIARAVSVRMGDVISFANWEFRIVAATPAGTDKLGATERRRVATAERRVSRIAEFRRMLETGAVEPFFQVVVALEDDGILGYELLGRARQFGVVCQPRELFEIAGSLKAEADLSRLFRMKGMEAHGQLAAGAMTFLNVHPAEMKDMDRLLESLRDLRRLYPDRPFCAEISERAVTDPGEVRVLHSALRDAGIAIAYDDFGAGRARLVELVELPPDYLKFDMGLVQNLHRASPGRQNMVKMLVELATRQGVHSIAEGIESKEDADLCREYGFFAAQGYFFGKPYAPGAAQEETFPD